MATYAQRAQSIANALINGTASPAKIGRIGAAIAAMNGQTAYYSTLDDAGKAEFIVTFYRGKTTEWLIAGDVRTASELAISTAATDLAES